MSEINHLFKKLTLLFDLECNLDTALSASMYFINQTMESERTSVFMFQPWNQELSVFASLDLARDEIRIPVSSGLTGWVFNHQQPIIVNNAYDDSRFYKGVDDMTGFYTLNMICSPVIDTKNRCLGTLQAINKKNAEFSQQDLELLSLIAGMMAVAIRNNRCYNESLVTSHARKKCIDRFLSNIDHVFESKPLYGT